MYVLRFPTLAERGAVEQACWVEQERLRAQGMLTRKQIETQLRQRNIWTAAQAHRLTQLQKQLERSKPIRTLEFFQDEELTLDQLLMEVMTGVRFTQANLSPLYEEHIKYPQAYQELRGLSKILNHHYLHSIETQIQEFRVAQLAVKCVATEKAPVWSSYDAFQSEARVGLSQKILMWFQDFLGGLSGKIVRRLARHPKWTLRWMSARETGTPLFAEPISDWNVNQLSLCYWSMFYDNLAQDPDSPKGDLLDNDDIVDAWMESERLKREQKKAAPVSMTKGQAVPFNEPQVHQVIFKKR